MLTNMCFSISTHKIPTTVHTTSILCPIYSHHVSQRYRQTVSVPPLNLLVTRAFSLPIFPSESSIMPRTQERNLLGKRGEPHSAETQLAASSICQHAPLRVGQTVSTHRSNLNGLAASTNYPFRSPFSPTCEVVLFSRNETRFGRVFGDKRAATRRARNEERDAKRGAKMGIAKRGGITAGEKI